MTAVYTSGAQIDHYEVIRQLGHGGMSRVYLASDTYNQQKVVLKFPNDELIGDISVYERYKREAEIGNRVNHPHVQHLINPGEEHSDEYLVMEYIHGRSLREVLEETNTQQPLPVSEALRIALQALRCSGVLPRAWCLSSRYQTRKYYGAGGWEYQDH